MGSSKVSPLDCQRDAFSLPDHRHYLNCAYQSPLARVVEEAGIQGIRMKRDPSAILPNHFFDDADEVRRRFARLVGVGDPQRISILPSVSYGVAIAAANLPVSRGQNIVLTHEQFPGNVYGWTALARRQGAEVRTVGPGDPGSGVTRAQAWSTRVLESIDRDTAVVTLGHVHWTDGSLFDLAAIGARAREVGAALVIDGTQSVGALPFEVAELQPDALIVAGYKWMLGPYSIALGYFGSRFDDGVPLEEGWIARGGSEDFQGLVDYRDDYQPGAIRYDVGERSNFILLPMLREALGLLLEWGPTRIQDYCVRLTAEAAPALMEMGYSVPTVGPRAHHILGIRMPGGLDLRRVSNSLREAGVFASLRGSALRVSPNVYNTPEDIAALVDALRQARG